MMDLCALTLCELAKGLREGAFSSEEIVKAYLASISEKDALLHAYLEVFAQEALQAARESDFRRAKRNALSELDGVPIAVKDNLCIKGHIVSCASKMLKDFVSPYDATAIVRLKALGMPILGRLNMDEFAMGDSTENSAFFVTRNPVNPNCIAGGSSGGCAAAVAAHIAPIALGSDTGGSLRQPAAHCGVVGVKPAYGSISRYGLVAFASSLDTVGVISRNTEDAALLLPYLCGSDGYDQTVDASLQSAERGCADGMTIGLLEECLGDGLKEDVRQAVESAAQRLKSKGHLVKRVSIPLLPSALSCYYVISAAEASSNLARYDGVRYGHRAQNCTGLDEMYRQSREEGFGMEVKRRILLGIHALHRDTQEAYYLRAQAVRDALLAQTEQALMSCDALLLPVTPSPARRIGETLSPMEQYQGDLYTVPANLTGLPALSIPFGKSVDGLPIGVGMMSAKHRLNDLLALAGLLEGGEAQ